LATLANSKTIENLSAAFAAEAQANRRYLYFAKQADDEGQFEISGTLRAIAEVETAHAMRHLDFVRPVSDPVTHVSISDLKGMIESALKGEIYESSTMYPTFAKQAREEGFVEIAQWFEAVAGAEKIHVKAFQGILSNLK
jgi:rubrerythrin